MEPEETEDILEACEEKRWAVFRDLRHKREKKGPSRGKQEALVGASKREGSLARKLAR